LLLRPDEANTLALRPDEAKFWPKGSFGIKDKTRRSRPTPMLRGQD